jgi:molybdenum cofactor sulfurtransferase
MIPNSFIENTASNHSISLRTGCMCNPGGATALLELQPLMAQLSDYSHDVTLAQFETMAGRELGVVRVSLGLVSNFTDVQRVIRFAERIADEQTFKDMWEGWQKLQNESGNGLVQENSLFTRSIHPL